MKKNKIIHGFHGKYIQNNKRCGDCQLVTAVNALRFLTDNAELVTDAQYEKLTDLAGCRYGAAISIEKVHKKLGICIKDMYHGLIDALRSLPVEVTIWHPRYGLHSVLIVGYEPKSEAIQVTNFRYETTLEGWIFVERFEPWIARHCGKMCSYELR
jgi:hypothetical protein